MRWLRGFFLVWRQAAGQALRGKRGAVLVLLAFLPVGISLLQVSEDPTIDISNFLGTILMGVFQFVAPFAGLLLGIAVLGDEIEGRTITYLFTRPLPRPVFYTGRLLGYATTFGILLAVSVFLITKILGGPRVDLSATHVGGTIAISVGGFLVYTAFFAVLRAFFEKALYIGFFLGFIFEGFVSKMPASGLSSCSVWHHLALLETRLFEGWWMGNIDELIQGIDRAETVRGSLTVLAAIFLASLVVGCWHVKTREIRVPAAVA